MDMETMEYLDRKQRNFEKGLDAYITRGDDGGDDGGDGDE